jgi:Arc/MetJ-type ribon-helix-helix transcriptional regulator
MERTRLVDLVFRIPRAHREALRELTKRTRIRNSEFLREALADLLAKYEQDLE